MCAILSADKKPKQTNPPMNTTRRSGWRRMSARDKFAAVLFVGALILAVQPLFSAMVGSPAPAATISQAGNVAQS